MVQLNKTVIVDDTANHYYTITLADATYEQTYVFNVGCKVSAGGSLTVGEAETALQDFANALAATHPTLSLTSITKTAVSETTL